jgi:hypothetical protein
MRMDLGGRRGMKHMLDHLVARPEKGLLIPAGESSSARGRLRTLSV